MRRTVVLDVAEPTRSLIGNRTPRLRQLLPGSADIRTITPALTCSVQSTYLTGRLPSTHDIVGNGWYFRELGEVLCRRAIRRSADTGRTAVCQGGVKGKGVAGR